jgi:hypothetical protein
MYATKMQPSGCFFWQEIYIYINPVFEIIYLPCKYHQTGKIYSLIVYFLLFTVKIFILSNIRT